MPSRIMMVVPMPETRINWFVVKVSGLRIVKLTRTMIRVPANARAMNRRSRSKRRVMRYPHTDVDAIAMTSHPPSVTTGGTGY
jgi:hypothetical protein